MRETLKLLQGLQDLDLSIYRARDELRRLPKERDRRRQLIDGEKVRLQEHEVRQRELRAKIKEIEDLTTGQRQRIRKLENEASGSRGDTATMVAYQHEIRTLMREISESEEEGLGLVEQADKIEKERAELAGLIEQADKEFEEYDANVQKELAEAQERLDGLEADRKQRMGAPVRPDVLEIYSKLLEAREGQAIALLEDRICQGCYVNVPSNIYVKLARGVDLVRCPSCGRILYLADRV